MDLGVNFSAKLEPFLLMAKSLKGAAAAKLIQDATSAPGVFVFSELLELPNIQELAKSEQHAKFLSLLQLFSYKTYQDYLQHQDSLPPLNKTQTTKLKHLSIVTLAEQRRILPYADLLKALDVQTVRELEDLIIDAIYLDILRGKLDQKQEQLEVEYTMGRDLEPGKLEQVLAALQDWASTTAAVLSTLDVKISSVTADAAAAKKRSQDQEQQLQDRLKELHDKQKSDKGLGGSSMIRNRPGFSSSFLGSNSTYTDGKENGKDRDAYMDVDEPTEVKGKNRNDGGSFFRATSEAASKPQRKRNKI